MNTYTVTHVTTETIDDPSTFATTAQFSSLDEALHHVAYLHELAQEDTGDFEPITSITLTIDLS
jgi:hypothetical protein